MIRTFVALSALTALAGCADKEEVAALRGQIDTLNASVAILSRDLEDAQKTLKRVADTQLMSGPDRSAIMTPGNTGYDLIAYDLGVMAVGLREIEPYANGTRVHLVLGNLSSASVDGLRLTLAWGKLGNSNIPIPETRKTRSENINERLQAGAWTKVVVLLPNTAPADVGYVEASSAGHQSISLIK